MSSPRMVVAPATRVAGQWDWRRLTLKQKFPENCSDVMPRSPTVAPNPYFLPNLQLVLVKENSRKHKSNTYATIVSAGIPASTFVPLSFSAATTPQQSDTTIPPNEHLFLKMCEQIQALSTKIEGLETAWATQQLTQHQSPASEIQTRKCHASEPDPAPNLIQLTEVLSTLITKFDVLQHDMANLKGQLQASVSPSTPSPSRKKSKIIDNHPAATPQDEGPYPSLHNADHLPSVRPDGTPDEGEMQDDDVDHESL